MKARSRRVVRQVGWLPDVDIDATVRPMTDETSTLQRFMVIVGGRPRGGISVAIPFDPGLAWGDRDRYHVHGTIGGNRFRGSLEALDGTWSLQLGPTWCRSPGFGPGDEVEVVMRPEGPHSTTMGADVAAAFAADPAAARYFDSLPSFYRNNHAPGSKAPSARRRGPSASPRWST